LMTVRMMTPRPMTGSTPVIELVTLRLLEVVRAGESDPGRLTEATVSKFKG
jgi:hypothetical protein